MVSILIVEDERIAAEDIQESLEHLGYTVCAVASSGKEALKKAEKTAPDLALVDIVLKGTMDGIETAQTIRSQHDIPVIYLTAYDDEDTLHRAKLTEPHGYLLKPFKERELHTTIEMALHKHEMEKKVKENELWLDTTLKSIGDGVITTDEKGLITFMNAVAEKLTGWTQKEAVGTPLNTAFSIVDEKTGENLEDPVKKVIREGTLTGSGNNTVLIAKDGIRLPIHNNAAPIINEGVTTGVVLTFRDISERRQIEKKLRESEEKYKHIAENSIDGVGMAQEEKIIYVNDAFCNIFGYKNEELIGESLLKPVAPEDIQLIKERAQKRIKGEEVPNNYVFRGLKKDGTLLFIEVSASQAFIYRGKPTILTILRDVTKRKQAEMLLRESESRYHSLFEDSPLSLWEEDWSRVKKYLDTVASNTDVRTYVEEHPEAVTHCVTLVKLLDVNKATLQLHGTNTKQELLKNLGTAFTEEILPVFKEEVIALSKGLTHFKAEAVHKTLSGKTKHLAIYVNVAPGYESTLGKVLVSMLDITERKRAEMQLKNLFDASKLINSTMDVEETFQFISDSVQSLVGFDYFVIFLVSKDKDIVYPAYASEKIQKHAETLSLVYGDQMVGQCIMTKESLLNNAKTRALTIPRVTDSIRSEIVIPLVIEDECAGALYIAKAADAYTREDITVLQPLGEVVSSAIANSRLYDEVQEFSRVLEERIKERSRRIETILNTKQELQQQPSWEEGLVTIVESMGRLGFERSAVFLVDPMKKTLESHYGAGAQLPENITVSLSETEYFGVQCVLEKKTIYVKDSFLVEGKQMTPDSSSFVWVPIVVQGEAFAALAADNVESNNLVTEEDVKDLEILAGMCAAFIDRTRVLIEPIAEKSLSTELKYWLEPGEGYIVVERKPEKSFDVFCDLVTHEIPGFVVSRIYPEKIKRKYKLVKTPMVWLSKTQTENSLDPNDLSKLIYTIKNFTKKSKESVVLLDGLEYLITQTDFAGVLKSVRMLKDIIVLNNSRLLIPLHADALSKEENSLLEREFKLLSFE